jgi:hypothetical protein
MNSKEYYQNVYLYCKRKYYQAVCMFLAHKNIDLGDSEKEEKVLEPIEKFLKEVKSLLKKQMKEVLDLIIILNLHSSF